MKETLYLLKELAQTSKFNYKHAAAVLDERDNIISTGINIRKTHTLQARHAKKVKQDDKVYLHAEISALVKCRSKPYSVVVVRVRNDSSLAMAKPCPVCTSAMIEAGIRRIIYSNSNGELVEELI